MNQLAPSIPDTEQIVIPVSGWYSRKTFGKRSKKNLIKYLYFGGYKIIGSIISKKDKALKIKDEKTGNVYLFTSDKNHKIDGSIEQVAIVKKNPKNITSNDRLEIKEWLKHPQIEKKQPSQILDSWKGAFSFKEENQVDDLFGLRQPQLGAIHSIMGHLSNATDIATVVLPTGTGKTETMLSVLACERCKKLLVIVPSDSLRDQLSDKFLNFGLLKKQDRDGNTILDCNALNPRVGVLKTKFDDVSELALLHGD